MADHQSPSRLSRIWSSLRHHLDRFFNDPFKTLWSDVVKVARAVWDFIAGIARFFVRLVRRVRGKVWIGIGVTLASLFVLLIAGYIAFYSWVDRQIAVPGKIDKIYYLGQGWGNAPDSVDRQTFYYMAQGAYLRNVRYDWLTNLERPWSKDRFAAPQYMRAYGFIEDEADIPANPGHLPVGFASRYDFGTGEMMLDLTCAACHTGELQFVKGGVRTAVRIDGGSGAHDFTGMHPGHFALDLFSSLTATYINPFKFSRFAQNVLKDYNTSEARGKLKSNLGSVIWALAKQSWTETKLHVYPTEEGFGRTDGLGRILNGTFAVNLSEKNYRVANAPVSYPPVWNIYKFDWVQYMGSVRQPMARNIGEAMGTGAKYYLLDPYGRPLPASQRYEASTETLDLNKIETALRHLTPPCWPEDVFGPIDRKLATAGAKLFEQHCVHCHGPYVAPDYVTEADAPLKLKKNWTGDLASDPIRPAENVPHWIMQLIPVLDIGTDPTSALNFVRYRLDLTPTGLTAEEVRRALTPYYKENYTRQVAYYLELKNRPKDPGYDGAAATWQHLTDEGEEGYLKEQLGPVQLSSVGLGDGLNYLITLVRDQSYKDLDIVTPQEHQVMDGYGQLDIPQVYVKYKARPLAGIWATPPFLHNGSVPTLYQMLVPAYRRDKTFYRKETLFDPRAVGLQTNSSQKGAFLFDTSIQGNSNLGHEFRAGYKPWHEGDPPTHGVIGPELTEYERWAIVEYLKVHRDDNNDNSCSWRVPAQEVKP